MTNSRVLLHRAHFRLAHRLAGHWRWLLLLLHARLHHAWLISARMLHAWLRHSRLISNRLLHARCDADALVRGAEWLRLNAGIWRAGGGGSRRAGGHGRCRGRRRRVAAAAVQPEHGEHDGGEPGDG